MRRRETVVRRVRAGSPRLPTVGRDRRRERSRAISVDIVSRRGPYGDDRIPARRELRVHAAIGDEGGERFFVDSNPIGPGLASVVGAGVEKGGSFAIRRVFDEKHVEPALLFIEVERVNAPAGRRNRIGLRLPRPLAQSKRARGKNRGSEDRQDRFARRHDPLLHPAAASSSEKTACARKNSGVETLRFMLIWGIYCPIRAICIKSSVSNARVLFFRIALPRELSHPCSTSRGADRGEWLGRFG